MLPLLANKFAWREASERPQAAGKVAGCGEVIEMPLQLGTRLVVEAPDGRLFDRSVHPLALAVGSRVFHLGQAMLDAVFIADPIEDVVKSVLEAPLIGKLDAIIGENRMDGVGNGFDRVAQELRRDHLAPFSMQINESELAGPVDCDEQP